MLPATSISRQFLTLWAAATKLLLGLLVCGWLLLALSWAVLHGAIVPRIDEFRPQLESLASRATGLRVEIGELSAHSTGVFPSFELKQVRLLDAAGQPALQLPQVLIALSPRSLMTASLEQLVIRGADLDVRLTADGRLLLAGIALSREVAKKGQPISDWLLSQREWALLGGTLRWTDEQHGVSLVLSEVDAVMRNPGQKHQLRIDATPPPEWGERLSLQGSFRQPLLSRSPSDWQQWSGQLYAHFGRVDLQPLQAYARLAGLSLGRGQGALRSWVDVKDGRMVAASADLALDAVELRLAPQLQPLEFDRLAGRLSWQDLGGRGLDLRTESLSFEMADGLQWPGGNLALKLELDAQGQATQGQLKADRLDLQVLARIAHRLPLPASWQEAQGWAPQGLLEQIEASWQGPLDHPTQLGVNGRVSALELAARPDAGQPGLGGMNLDFKLQRAGGEDKAQASFTLNKGWLEFPGVFQEPRLQLDKFTGQLQLKHSARGTEVELRQASLQAADAQGQFQGSWKRLAGGERRGQLDLQGQLSRADGTRVWRYLPEALPARVRQYVRQAVQQAPLSQVRFKVKGPLASFPFEAPGSGDFQVSAQVRGGQYAYVPAASADNAAKSWPALTQVDAELLFNRASLQVKASQARVAGLPGLQVGPTEVLIAHLGQRPVVEVAGEIKGALAQGLALVQKSPLAELTPPVLARISGSGNAELQLKLSLPLEELGKTRVQGLLALPGNDVQLTPETPLLGRLRGNLAFSETGFQTLNAQARLLGGELRFDGGLRAAARRGEEPELSFRGQGTASAEALQQWRELQPLAPLLRQASGSTSYSASLGLRLGVWELGLTSSLAGLALALPEPLNKAAATPLPLRLEKTLVRESMAAGQRLQERISLNLGPGSGLARPLSVSYLRDIAGAQPQVISGLLSLGERESEPDPAVRGVRAQLQLPQLDLDAWEPLLKQWAGSEAGAGEGWLGYLPSSYSLRTAVFKAQGHSLQNLALSGQREGEVWRARLSANELSGQGEYRQANGTNPARLYARLSHLRLGGGAASGVETLLDRQPGSLPTVDLVVDELELRGKKLGRLEVQALSRNLAAREASREWQLSRLRLSVPEAQLTATGSWAALPGAASSSAAPRSTQLNFKLEVADSGELLKRLGMDGAIRRGKGRLEGQIGWTGSPLALHYPSLGGQMVVDVESGQFLKADPGAAKLLGVLNLQALPRRLTLDFRDVFSEGFAFDWLRGEVAIRQGVASTGDLRMKGVNAAVLMEGSADIARETQDLHVVVVPEINAGTASLLAYAANPAMAVGTFLAQWLLRQPLSDANTQEFKVSGPWSDPQIQRLPRQRPAPETDRTGNTP